MSMPVISWEKVPRSWKLWRTTFHHPGVRRF